MAEDTLRPVSYRINDETKEKIKEITDELGLGQQGAMQKLLEAYNIQKSKAGVTDIKAQVLFDDFEKTTSKMNQLYLNILEALQEANDNARISVSQELESKDFTIRENNENLKRQKEELVIMQQLKEEATEKAQKYVDENLKLAKEIERLTIQLEDTKKNYEGIVIDKNNLNIALTDTCNELKSKVENMLKEHVLFENVNEELKIANEELSKVKAENDVLLQKNKHLVNELEETKKHLKSELEEAKRHEANELESQRSRFEIDKERALLELERKLQDSLIEIENKKQQEIDKYQEKYFTLLEQRNIENESVERNQ